MSTAACWQLELEYNIQLVEEDFSDGLQAILGLSEGPERTAALASWFQSLYEGTKVPVLVGGSAAEIYSGGSYSSGDLDFVGEVPKVVARRLQAAGFARQGRHWVHAAGQVFLEVPGSSLEPPERAIRVQVGRWSVLALSPEDILVDRLAVWQFWRSAADGVAAFWLRWHQTDMDEERLTSAAAGRGVSESLERLRSFISGLAGGEPSAEELSQWATTHL